MKKGKIAKTLLALALSASCVLASGCDFLTGRGVLSKIGDPSETYVGVVSETKYSSSESAAEGYVKEELGGYSNNYHIVNSVSKGSLSPSEIDGLNLPDEVRMGAQAVEEFEVEYSTSKNSYTASNASSTKTVRVYVIKYVDAWKYYSPLPLKGDTITKSYYDSVFDAQQFKNCTFESTSTVEMDLTASYQGETESVKMDITTEQLAKYANNKIYLEQTIKGVYNQGNSKTEYNQTLYAYMEESNGTMVCYVKMDNDSEWIKGDLTTIGFSSIDELTPFANQYLDHSYFTKTDNGFEISEENADAYVAATMDMLSDVLSVAYLDSMDIDMDAQFYVVNGILSGMTSKGTLKMNINESYGGYTMSIKADASFSGESTCVDYGTTIVEKPF